MIHGTITGLTDDHNLIATCERGEILLPHNARAWLGHWGSTQYYTFLCNTGLRSSVPIGEEILGEQVVIAALEPKTREGRPRVFMWALLCDVVPVPKEGDFFQRSQPLLSTEPIDSLMKRGARVVVGTVTAQQKLVQLPNGKQATLPSVARCANYGAGTWPKEGVENAPNLQPGDRVVLLLIKQSARDKVARWTGPASQQEVDEARPTPTKSGRRPSIEEIAKRSQTIEIRYPDRTLRGKLEEFTVQGGRVVVVFREAAEESTSDDVTRLEFPLTGVRIVGRTITIHTPEGKEVIFSFS